MYVTLKRILLGQKFKMQRHEDRITKGIPDLSFATVGPNGWMHGWLELKYLAEWPKNPKTIVKVPKFYKEQKIWLFTFGIGCFFLIQIDKDWLLFDHIKAFYVGTWTREDMERNALKVWVGKPEVGELIPLLVD